MDDLCMNSDNAAGLISKIVLKNFMCHEHLEVNFNRHINFICGKNGSGKSAILTALVIVLGGKTSDTNRGSNLKSLIKSGKSQAIIEITLTNTGPKAFKPEIYGDTITIVRTINQSASLYKIIKHNGRVVAYKKKELNDIISCFKIQINNPITILNQDMAKSFIKTSNPKDLYKFFLNGTLLNEMEENIVQFQEFKLPQVQNTIKEKSDELKFVFKDLNKIKEKHEKKKELMELEKDLKQLNIKYSWAQVYKTETELNNLDQHSKEVEEKIKNLETKIKDKDGTEREFIMKKEKLMKSLNELQKKKDDNLNKAMEAERKYNKVANSLKEFQHERKNMDKKLKNHMSGFKEATERLKLLDSQNAEAAAKRKLAESKKEALQTKIDELKTLIKTNNNHMRNLSVSLQKKSEEVVGSEGAFRQVTSNIASAQSRLRELKSHSSELTCFGNYVPKLVEEIQRSNERGRFEKKPVGPIGHYIKLNQASKFGDISLGASIEAILGWDLLCGFAVDNRRDFSELQSIFRKLNITNTPNVIITKFFDEVHDVRKHKARHPSFPSMFDALDISHPVAANVIIDQKSVESILLLPSSNEAYKLMELKQNVPVNCDRVVTPNSLFYPSPKYRSYNITNRTTTTYLQANKDSLIKELEENLKNLSVSEKEKQKHFNEAKMEERKIKTSLTEVERETQRINKQIVAAEMELLHLSNEEENVSLEQDNLKEDIDYRKKAIDELQRQIKKNGESIESLKEDYKKALNEKENILTENHDNEISEIQDSLNEVEAAANEFSLNYKKFKSQKKDQMIMLEKLQVSLTKLKENLRSQTVTAEESGEPVDKNCCPPMSELKNNLSEVLCEIKVIKEFIGDGTIEEITEDLQNNLLRIETIQNIIRDSEMGVLEITRNIDELKTTFESLRRSLSKKIMANFRSITKLRNYLEELIFDHGNRKLSIVVKTDAKSQNTTSVLSLSGGERSYSMVAFILSLWQEMALPFYFLDEFDVFMDPVNRNLIIKLLLMHARINNNQQFVFFTPNDFEVDITADVGIFRMIDPRNDLNLEL